MFFRIYLKVYQVIYSSLTICSPNFKALASIVFLILSDMVKMPKFTKGHNSWTTHEQLLRIHSKDNQVIFSSLPVYSLNFKALTNSFLRYLLTWQNVQIEKGRNSLNIFQNLFKRSSSNLRIITNLLTSFQGSSFNTFCDILLVRFHPYFLKGHNSGNGHNPDRKKKTCFMRNPYMKFQNPSMDSSKIMLCIKKCAM